MVKHAPDLQSFFFAFRRSSRTQCAYAMPEHHLRPHYATGYKCYYAIMHMCSSELYVHENLRL